MPLQGWMLKLGDNSILTRWKRRYFVLGHGYELKYYQSEDINNIENLVGHVDLRESISVLVTEQTSDYCSFSLQTRKRTYYLRVQTEAELIYWMTGLSEAIMENSVQLKEKNLNRKSQVVQPLASPSFSNFRQFSQAAMSVVLGESTEVCERAEPASPEVETKTINDKDFQKKYESLRLEKEMEMLNRIEDLKSVHQREITELKATHKTELHQLKRQYEDQLAATKGSLQEKQAEVEKIKRDSATEISALNNYIKMKEDEVRLLNGRMKEIFHEYEKSIQETSEKSQKQIKEYQVTIEKQKVLVSELRSSIKSLADELTSKDLFMHNSLKIIRPLNDGKDKNNKQDKQDKRDKPDKQEEFAQKLDKEKEAKFAFHAQSLYLDQEVRRLETELRLEKERAVKIQHIEIEVNNESLTVENFRKLITQLEDVKEKYFVSLGRNVKLQGIFLRQFSSVSIQELYLQAIRENVKIEDWPNWITDKILGCV